MKKTINKIVILLLVGLTLACTDESKDPVKFGEVAKGTYLALRGGALDNLNNTGCSNSFFKNNVIGDEVFTFDADFLSENQDNLSQVLVYAATTTIPRVQVATVAGSAFTLPSGAASKRGTVSVTLANVIAALGLSPAQVAALGPQDLKISIDLELNDGTKILASNIINGSLFESVIFNPAMNLTYCANDAADFVPVATLSLAVGKPLRDVTDYDIDTLMISYDYDVIDAPTVDFEPASAITLIGGLVADGTDGFYQIFQATGGFTGTVTATVSGATAEVAGVVLTQDDADIDINIDNIAPVLISTSTGTNIGVGQFVTMKVTFNEALTKDTAIVVTIDGSALGLASIDPTDPDADPKDYSMVLSSDGKSATLIYIFKLEDPAIPATHGNLTVEFGDAFDKAGNSVAIGNASLLVDVDPAGQPVLTPSGGYDLGTQIKWVVTVPAGGGTPAGSTTGTVYFIALTTGDVAPTGFSVDLDGNGTFVIDDTATSNQEGKVTVTSGTSGTAFTTFNANGDFDVYGVFVSSSGTISDVTAATPVTITMN